MELQWPLDYLSRRLALVNLDLNAYGMKELTPFHFAIACSNLDVVTMFIEILGPKKCLEYRDSVLFLFIF